MSDVFCAMPFMHLLIEPTGAAKVCCMAQGFVLHDGREMNLYEDSLDDIWMTGFMKSVREAMRGSAELEICRTCYEYEKSGLSSYREISNKFFIETYGQDAFDQLRTGSAEHAAESAVLEGPSYVQLILGNTCNLSCRMCNAYFSSTIAADPVHGRWATDMLSAPVPEWRQNKVVVGPAPRIGVRSEGFGPACRRDGNTECEMTGKARLTVPVRARDHATMVSLSWRPDVTHGRRIHIAVDGKPYFDGSLPASGSITIALDAPLEGPETTIEVACRGDGNEPTGLIVREIALHRPAEPGARRRVLGGRFAADGPWHEQNSVLFAELFAEPGRLRKVQITGGEPLTHPRMAAILDYLIDMNAAQHIVLNFSSNATRVDPSLLERMSRFQRVEANLSIEGVAEIQEYIRYPCDWQTVTANVARIQALPNAFVYVHPTVQMYNFMTLDRLAAWALEMGVKVRTLLLFMPDQLSIHVAPPKARRAAGRRLSAFLEQHDAAARFPDLANLAADLCAADDDPDPRLVKKFMTFTNDLDLSRGQSVHDVLPELVDHLVNAGFPWQQATRFAKSRPEAPSKPVSSPALEPGVATR